MQEYTAAISQYLQNVRRVLAEPDIAEIDAICGIFKKAYNEQRTIFIMGNGGSASTASHIACDINKGACLRAQKKFRVMALTDNLPIIMAIANDIGYDSIFVEQYCQLIAEMHHG